MALLRPAGIDFLDRAPLRVDTVISLRQAPHQVWRVLTDDERWPQWFRSCQAARATSDPAGGIGSTRRVHVDRFEVDELFIAWDAPTRWGFTVERANLPIADSVVELVHLEPQGDGTRLTHTFAVAPKRWLRPLSPVLHRRVSRLFRAGYDGLQPYLDRRFGAAVGRPGVGDGQPAGHTVSAS